LCQLLDFGEYWFIRGLLKVVSPLYGSTSPFLPILAEASGWRTPFFKPNI
jgi:hypothetical protein